MMKAHEAMQLAETLRAYALVLGVTCLVAAAVSLAHREVEARAAADCAKPDHVTLPATEIRGTQPGDLRT